MRPSKHVTIFDVEADEVTKQREHNISLAATASVAAAVQFILLHGCVLWCS